MHKLQHVESTARNYRRPDMNDMREFLAFCGVVICIAIIIAAVLL
jgi:hypothetical protein